LWPKWSAIAIQRLDLQFLSCNRLKMPRVVIRDNVPNDPNDKDEDGNQKEYAKNGWEVYGENGKLLGELPRRGTWQSPNDWWDARDGKKGCTVYLKPKGSKRAKLQVGPMHEPKNPHKLEWWAKKAKWNF